MLFLLDLARDLAAELWRDFANLERADFADFAALLEAFAEVSAFFAEATVFLSFAELFTVFTVIADFYLPSYKVFCVVIFWGSALAVMRFSSSSSIYIALRLSFAS